jgi:hypothetical protein
MSVKTSMYDSALIVIGRAMHLNLFETKSIPQAKVISPQCGHLTEHDTCKDFESIQSEP